MPAPICGQCQLLGDARDAKALIPQRAGDDPAAGARRRRHSRNWTPCAASMRNSPVRRAGLGRASGRAGPARRRGLRRWRPGREMARARTTLAGIEAGVDRTADGPARGLGPTAVADQPPVETPRGRPSVNRSMGTAGHRRPARTAGQTLPRHPGSAQGAGGLAGTLTSSA